MPTSPQASSSSPRWDLSDLGLFITTELQPSIDRLQTGRDFLNVYIPLEKKNWNQYTKGKFTDLFDQMQRLSNAWRDGGYYRYHDLPKRGVLRTELLQTRLKFVTKLIRSESTYEFEFDQNALKDASKLIELSRVVATTIGALREFLGTQQEQAQKDVIQTKGSSEQGLLFGSPKGKQKDQGLQSYYEKLRDQKIELLKKNRELFKKYHIDTEKDFAELDRIAFVAGFIKTNNAEDTLIASVLGSRLQHMSSEDLAVIRGYVLAARDLHAVENQIDLTHLNEAQQVLALNALQTIHAKGFGNEGTQVLLLQTGSSLRNTAAHGSKRDATIAKQALSMRDEMLKQLFLADQLEHEAKEDVLETYKEFVKEADAQNLLYYLAQSEQKQVVPRIEEPAEQQVKYQDRTSQHSAIERLRGTPKKKEKEHRTLRALNAGKNLAMNPTYWGAGAALGTTGLLISAIGNAGVFASTLGGAGLGAAAGFYIGGTVFPIIGAIPGAAIGSFLGGLTGRLAGGAIFQPAATSGALTGIAQTAATAVPGLSATAAATASNAGITAQSLGNIALQAAGKALGAGLNTTGALLSGVAGAGPGFLGTTAGSGIVVTGPIIAAGAFTLVAASTFFVAMLAPDQVGLSESKYIIINKDASTVKADHPTSVTYTITVKAKAGYSIAITDANDSVTTNSKNKPISIPMPLDQIKKDLVGKTITGDTVAQSTYTINYADPAVSSSYEDTSIKNIVELTFNVSGNENVTAEKWNASVAVVFGNPPAFACWPTTGIIVQGPFGTFSHAPPGNTYGAYLDAVDIASLTGKEGEPIYAPFAGKIYFFDWTKQAKRCAAAGYGNCAMLYTASGGFILGHMNHFADGFVSGQSYDVNPGDLIGYMGNTGFSQGPHTHYEYEANLDKGAAVIPPAFSTLETLVPEPIQYTNKPNVPNTQIVHSDQCSNGGTTLPSQPGAVIKTIGCFDLVNGDEEWGHTGSDEEPFVENELNAMMSDSGVHNVLCSKGKISLIRTKAGYPDGGCKIGQGSSGGYVADSYSIHICDKVFLDKQNYGAYTLWHEPGHIIQNRYSDWKSHFSDQKVNGYLPSYPASLGRSYVEDFAESWGMCNKTRVDGSSGYRDAPNLSYTQEPYASHQCADITSVINAYGN